MKLKKNNINSLVLGCARFSGFYGVGSKNEIDINSIKEILKKNKKKISQIDTAISYRKANKKLESVNLKNFKVCSKIPHYSLSEPFVDKKIYNTVKKHMASFKLKELEILYLHDPKQLLNKNRKKLINILKKMKSQKIVKKIGISVYSPSELNNLLKVFRPDVVQMPINIFDRRFLKKNILFKLKRKKILIYFRSIFLQGILLKNFENLPKYFFKWRNLFEKWEKWLKNNNLSKVEGCLSVLNLVSTKANLIIGAESNKQIKEILNSLKTKAKPPQNIFSNDTMLINPTKWKIITKR